MCRDNLLRGLIMLLMLYYNGRNSLCEAKDVRTKELRRIDCNEESIKTAYFRSCGSKRSASIEGSDKSFIRAHRLESSEVDSKEMDAMYNEILGFSPFNFKYYGGPQKYGGRRQIQTPPQRFLPQPLHHPSRQVDHNVRQSIIFPRMTSRPTEIPDYAALFDPLASNMDTDKKRMLRQAFTNLLQLCCGGNGCNSKDFRHYCVDI